MIPHFRLACPVSDLVHTDAMYQTGFGLIRLGHFEDHEGCDGVMLGMSGGDYHFEFTYCRFHPVTPAPTPEDLLVFYIPDPNAWEQRCDALLGAGFVEVDSMNPYWARDGCTFQDADGYRLACNAHRGSVIPKCKKIFPWKSWQYLIFADYRATLLVLARTAFIRIKKIAQLKKSGREKK